ncbi:hypothetical protein [Kineococcus auxinigenes]|uniref:hypothetical protein n=1 Tax=unclassified Kineococcus TaxID=2621656 RepID=UPI003D7CF65C
MTQVHVEPRTGAKPPASAMQGAISLMVFLVAMAVLGVGLGHLLHSYLLGAGGGVLLASIITAASAWARRRQ